MEFELLERAAIDNISLSQCSLVREVLGDEGRWGEGREEGVVREDEPSVSAPPDKGSVMGECGDGCHGEMGECGEGCHGESSSQDLDKTLTPSQKDVGETELVGGAGQSLAAGLVFSDEEEWESFNHGSPPNQRREKEKGGEERSVSSGSPSPWVSPLRGEQLDSGGKAVVSTPLSTSPPPPHQPQQSLGECEPRQQHSPHNVRDTVTSTVAPLVGSVENRTELPLPPPPPSALAARLFPALRQERERILLQQKKQNLPQPADDKTTPTATTPPSYPSEPELRDKLGQLETEIERFRVMNSKLEKQSREKEQVRSVASTAMLSVCQVSFLLAEPGVPER